MEYYKEFNKIKINITSDGEIFDYHKGKININDIDLPILIFKNYCSEENQNVIKTVGISNEFDLSIDTVFLAVKDIEENLNDKASANHITGHFFNWLKQIWNPNFSKYKIIIEIDLWNNLISKVLSWEKINNYKIYKGTPYYFNAGNYLFAGNYDLAFNYTYKAMEEDKYHGIREDPNFDFKELPAFLFASLNVDRPDNYLYPIVKHLAKVIEGYIVKYNTEFSESFTFDIFKSKFTTQINMYKEPILYFVYLLNALNEKRQLIQQYEDLYNNNFANMRNLDLIFSFCLFLDKLLSIKTGASSIRGNTKELIKTLYRTLERTKFNNLCKSLNVNPGNPMRAIDKVNFILNYNNLLFPNDQSYTIKKNKQLLNSMLIYFLRNEGAHNIIFESLDVITFEKILNSLFFQLFIIIDKILINNYNVIK